MADARFHMLTFAVLSGAAVLSGCEDCKSGGGGGGDAAVDTGAVVLVDSGDGGVLSAIPIPSASVAAMVNPEKLPAYSGPTGSVEGTITVTGDPAPATPADFSRCPEAEKTWGHAFREGPPGPNGARPLADAIVAVTAYKGFIPETQEAKQVTIEGCAFASRTTTMTYGQRLDVKNNATDFWTPQLQPQQSAVLMMAIPKGEPVKLYPKKPGHYLLLDHDRKYAVVDVYAFLYPLHTSSDTSGHYRIDGLPVGKMKLSTRHPQIDGEVEVELNVNAAGVVQKVDLVLKNVNREAGAPDAGKSDAAPAPTLR